MLKEASAHGRGVDGVHSVTDFGDGGLTQGSIVEAGDISDHAAEGRAQE